MYEHPLVKWTARISGLIVTLLFGAFLIGDGIMDIFQGQAKDLYPLLPFLGIIGLAYLVAWYRPVPGGKWMIAGSIGIAIFFLVKGEPFMAFIYGFPALVVGSCFLASVNKRLV